MMTMIWSVWNERMWRATTKQQKYTTKNQRKIKTQQIMLTSNSCIRLQTQLHCSLNEGYYGDSAFNSYSSCKSKHSKHVFVDHFLFDNIESEVILNFWEFVSNFQEIFHGIFEIFLSCLSFFSFFFRFLGNLLDYSLNF